MNYSDIQTKSMLKNVRWSFFLAIIFYMCFVKVGYAKPTLEECDKKNLDLMLSALPATGESSKFDIGQYITKLNVASYKRWLGIKTLFEGECSHASGASGAVREADKNLQEAIERCEANSQGSNCGVGPVATNSLQNNTQTKASQSPIAADGLVDDPKVFGGSSSGKRLNR